MPYYKACQVGANEGTCDSLEVGANEGTWRVLGRAPKYPPTRVLGGAPTRVHALAHMHARAGGRGAFASPCSHPPTGCTVRISAVQARNSARGAVGQEYVHRFSIARAAPTRLEVPSGAPRLIQALLGVLPSRRQVPSLAMRVLGAYLRGTWGGPGHLVRAMRLLGAYLSAVFGIS